MNIQDAHREISGYLNKIAQMFDRPYETKITILIRNPWLEDGDMLLTNDADDMILTGIKKLQKPK